MLGWHARPALRGAGVRRRRSGPRRASPRDEHEPPCRERPGFGELRHLTGRPAGPGRPQAQVPSEPEAPVAAGLPAILLQIRHVRTPVGTMSVTRHRQDALGDAQRTGLGSAGFGRCTANPRERRARAAGCGGRADAAARPGGRDRPPGRISNVGDHARRVTLHEPADPVPTPPVTVSALKHRALALAARTGPQTAKVAPACKRPVVTRARASPGPGSDRAPDPGAARHATARHLKGRSGLRAHPVTRRPMRRLHTDARPRRQDAQSRGSRPGGPVRQLRRSGGNRRPDRAPRRPRSAQPLPSGDRREAGRDAMPNRRIPVRTSGVKGWPA